MSFSAKTAKQENLGTPTAGGGDKKSIDPGQHIVRMHNMTMSTPQYLTNKGETGYQIDLVLETPPMGEGFEGFRMDNNDPNSPTYAGQSSYVKATNFPFTSYQPAGKEAVTAEQSAFRWISQFVESLGLTDALAEANIEGNSIQEYFDGVKSFIMRGAKDRWFAAVIGGQAYEKDGFDRWSLFLVGSTKKVRAIIPVSGSDAAIPGELMPFDPTNKYHVVQKKVSPSVPSFGNSNGAASGSAGAGSADDLPF